jgi:hypothetical protein
MVLGVAFDAESAKVFVETPFKLYFIAWKESGKLDLVFAGKVALVQTRALSSTLVQNTSIYILIIQPMETFLG